MTGQAPIVIIKRKQAHAGHHGGAWKVAYADFVTAMMALFIVMWLLNSSKDVQKAVGGYFRDPQGTASKVGTSLQGSADNLPLSKEDMAKLKQAIMEKLQTMPTFDKIKDHIEITITREGLRIELLEAERSTFFEKGRPEPTKNGSELLVTLAEYLGNLDNRISIEGHTDSEPYVGRPNYTNWELSTDRANAARRIMQANGIRSDQITQIRGFADQSLRKPTAPTDASNRRITLMVHRADVAPDGQDAVATAPGSSAREQPATQAKRGSQSKSRSDSGSECQGCVAQERTVAAAPERVSAKLPGL